MTLSIDLVLYVVAAVLFALAGFRVQAAVSWEWLAFAVLVVTLIV